MGVGTRKFTGGAIKFSGAVTGAIGLEVDGAAVREFSDVSQGVPLLLRELMLGALDAGNLIDDAIEDNPAFRAGGQRIAPMKNSINRTIAGGNRFLFHDNPPHWFRRAWHKPAVYTFFSCCWGKFVGPARN